MGWPTTLADLKQQSTFYCWDFDNIWSIGDGLPYLNVRGTERTFAFEGEGFSDDPYLVKTEEQLYAMSVDLISVTNAQKYYQLANDIAITAAHWHPIGFYNAFAGTFDGSGHTISGINVSGHSHAGLFGKNSGTIQNLTVSGSVSGGQYCGLLTGTNSGTIKNCFTSGTASGGSNASVGGLIGYNSGNVAVCGSIVDATSGTYAGGLIAYNEYNGKVTNCYAQGNVTGQSGYAGGLVGRNDPYSGRSVAIVENCYSIGAVSTGGGLIGSNSGTVTSSYYNGETSGCSDTNKGTPLTTAAMKTTTPYDGWDFNEVWTISAGINNGYPYLRSVTPLTNTVAPEMYFLSGGSCTIEAGKEKIISAMIPKADGMEAPVLHWSVKDESLLQITEHIFELSANAVYGVKVRAKLGNNKLSGSTTLTLSASDGRSISCNITVKSPQAETAPLPQGEFKVGILESVDENGHSVTIDGVAYQIPEDRVSSMSALLKNRKISDKRVVFLTSSKVASALERIDGIYDAVEGIVSLEVVPASIQYEEKDGEAQFSEDSVKLKATIELQAKGGYTKSELKSINGLSMTFQKLQLFTHPDADKFYWFHFGRTLGVLWKKTEHDVDLNSLTVPFGETKNLEYTMDVDTGKVPENVTSVASVQARLFYKDNSEKSELSGSMAVSIGNLVLQANKAASSNENLSAKANTMKTACDALSNYIALGPELNNYFSSKQVEAIQKIVAVRITEVLNANKVKSGDLFTMLGDKVREKIQDKIEDKLGINTGLIPVLSSTTFKFVVTGTSVNQKDTEVTFEVAITSFNIKDKSFSDFGTIEMTIQEKGSPPVDGTTGLMANADFTAFAEAMVEYINAAYSEVWGDSADNIAEMFISKPAYTILETIADSPSSNLFNLMVQPTQSYVKQKNASKKMSADCPVDVYIYNRDGKLCGSVINNIVDLSVRDVYCYVSGDRKSVYLMGDDYTVELVGSDTGTMDYTVEEYLDGELVRTVATNNVPLTEGKTYTGFVPDVVKIDNSVYELTTGDGDARTALPVDYDSMRTNSAGGTEISDMDVIGENLTAVIYCDGEDFSAYCASYNANGKMLHIDMKPLTKESNNVSFSMDKTDVVTMKLFVLDNQFIPQCVSETLELS